MVTETEESMPSIDWVGPSSFLSVSVARMRVILRLRQGLHIGQMERPEDPDPLPGEAHVLAPSRSGDLQDFPVVRGGLQAQHEAALLPDQRGPGEQRVVLADLAVGSDVEVGVLPAREE